MRIKVIGVGKLREKYLKDAVAEYTKRLSTYGKVSMVEVSDERDDDPAALKKEGDAILKQIRDGEYTIALAINGKTFDSVEFSEMLDGLGVRGVSDIVFIIGGSNGLHEDILKRADMLLSFSKMTFPHQLMRVILHEQIYRAYKINRGEKYHK
ncbi:MAG: 23S rRNA (pseudouridine(1915)-N(3))-methyltransferase RlmH [Clostridia bacterium]|nr:23S rRNA (pseudouridine(1915)-N(3))-methyltransferase RlmH [Clostridia bacterium]MBN2882102.1 23S rRNA (pseudouridine(1915)-N(3))-methyltransferase RlmH [Clostridia bacterium]